MEKGQLRAEANVSVRPAGSAELGVKTELTNINSFLALRLAIEHEVERQIAELEGGGQVRQETRGWDEARGVTYSQRSKEYAEDYRYFPEPDLPPLEIAPAWLDALRSELPELPAAQTKRFTAAGLSASTTSVVVEGQLGPYLDELARLGVSYVAAGNWIAGEIAPRLEDGREPPRAEHLAGLLKLVESGQVNRGQARDVLREAWDAGTDPAALVAERGLAQVSDDAALEGWVAEAIAAQPQAVADFRGGKQQAFGALMNEVRQRSDGRADMKRAGELLRKQLES